MKKIILLILLFSSILTYSQEKFDSYNSSYFKKDFPILIAEKNDKSIQFYIDVNSMDKSSKTAMLVLDSKSIDEFKTMVLSLKDIYIKWKKTAVDNKVTELDKAVEDKRISVTSAFNYGKWNFDFSTQLTAKFKIINNIPLMIIESDGLESSSNKFIKSDGFVIVFALDNEFDALVSKIDLTKANDYFAKKSGKEDLFKN